MGNDPSHFSGDSLPVKDVNWDDCQQFIKNLNMLTGNKFRLPTEAEWEYAARGGKYHSGYKYSGSDIIDDVAWYNGHVVSDALSKKANELGLYDMSGNMWEWCSDWYGNYPSSDQINPEGPASGMFRVLRGGSWSCVARRCRVSSRHSRAPGYYDVQNGFRLALDNE